MKYIKVCSINNKIMGGIGRILHGHVVKNTTGCGNDINRGKSGEKWYFVVKNTIKNLLKSLEYFRSLCYIRVSLKRRQKTRNKIH